MKEKLRIPKDIRRVRDLLKGQFLDLSDIMQEEVEEWFDGLNDAFRNWLESGVEPDWDAFRDDMNDICRRDGADLLFPDRERRTL